MQLLWLPLACGGDLPDPPPPPVFQRRGFAPPSDCGERLEPTAALVRWPYVQRVTETSAVIAFGTSTEVRSTRVVWGQERYWDHQASPTWTDLEGVVDSGLFGHDDLRLHHVELTGLTPGTEVCYRVEVDGEVVARGQSFWSAPPTDDSTIRFLVIGDFGAGTPEQRTIRDAMLPYTDTAHLLLTTGDNAYSSGQADEWQERVFEVYQELLTEVPLYPTWGNHDYATDDAAPALASNFLPENAWRPQDKERYWSMDWGPVHFIGLDTEDPALGIRESETDDELDWLIGDLETADRPWTIALWHKPAYSGMPGRSPDPAARLFFGPALEAAGAQLIFQGHNHMYERFAPLLSDQPPPEGEMGTVYITTAGGGRNLYQIGEADHQVRAEQLHHFMVVDVSRCKLTLRAIGQDGLEIDASTITRCD